jgi:hypothetical protein
VRIPADAGRPVLVDITVSSWRGVMVFDAGVDVARSFRGHERSVRTTTWYVERVLGEIVWTDESETHIARHGITTYEVEETIYTRPRWVAVGLDETRLVFGQTGAGRYLLVVVADGADGRDFILTARDMTDNEKRTFRAKGR